MAVTVIMFIDGWNGNRAMTTNVVSLLLPIYNLDFLRVCVYFIWQNPFRLQIVVKSIKNRHFWILPRIAQESVKYLCPRVNSFASFDVDVLPPIACRGCLRQLLTQTRREVACTEQGASN